MAINTPIVQALEFATVFRCVCNSFFQQDSRGRTPCSRHVRNWPRLMLSSWATHCLASTYLLREARTDPREIRRSICWIGIVASLRETFCNFGWCTAPLALRRVQAMRRSHGTEWKKI